jgi:FAD:protein FMN transferase
MGTAWQVQILSDAPLPASLHPSLQAAVTEIDQQMSTWRSDSALMRFNASPIGIWQDLPHHLLTVLDAALKIGEQTQGAFDIALGDAVAAWGYGGAPLDPAQIEAARHAARIPAHQGLDLDLPNARARKRTAQRYDLSGIAKGYGVDRLCEVLLTFGLNNALAAIDGELRAIGSGPKNNAWPILIEAPLHDSRHPLSLIELQNSAVATSGDYRHWVEAAGRKLSHTINPKTGAPLFDPPASVTVLAPTCLRADALATALMVMGTEQGQNFAAQHKLNALFLTRDGTGISQHPTGPIFAP